MEEGEDGGNAAGAAAAAAGDDGEGDGSGNGNGGGADLSWRRYPSEDDTEEEDLEHIAFTDSFREAAERLEEDIDGETIEALVVDPDDDDDREEEEGEEGDGNDAATFRRFVNALDWRRRQGGCRVVRLIHFDKVEWDRYRDDDLARFFGEVLPTHPTLEVISLERHEIPQPYLGMLFAGLRKRSGDALRKLELRCAIDHGSAQAAASMIRQNGPLHELWMDRGSPLDADDCKLIFQAALCNPHLRVLRLRMGAAMADTLDDVVARSSLRELVVIADEWPDECAASVARQLRTNTTLESLQLSPADDDGSPSPFSRPLVEVLQTYNVTLRKVTLRWYLPQQDEPVPAGEERALTLLRRRNRRIRRAVERDLEPRGYHVSPASLLPRALGTVSALPTLVYRLLRGGDLNALADYLLLLGRPRPGGRGAARGQKRGRQAPKAL